MLECLYCICNKTSAPWLNFGVAPSRCLWRLTREKEVGLTKYCKRLRWPPNRWYLEEKTSFFLTSWIFPRSRQGQSPASTCIVEILNLEQLLAAVPGILASFLVSALPQASSSWRGRSSKMRWPPIPPLLFCCQQKVAESVTWMNIPLIDGEGCGT